MLDEIDLDDETPTLATDAAPVVFAFDRSARVVDVDGHMRVEGCNLSKANVCPYLGSEIPDAAALGFAPEKVYNLYRDRAELEAAAPSFEGKPLMMKHVAVSADDPQKMHVVGSVSNVRYSHPYLVGDLNIWDGEAIAAIQSGEQEQISCGYRYRPVVAPGTIDGLPYDGIMRDIYANHVALVDVGRAGPDVVVKDSLPKDFLTMKRSELIAGLAEFMKPDADLIAVDAAIVKLAADGKKAKDEEKDDEKVDAADESEEKDEPKAKDKKKAKDEKDEDEDCGMDEEEEKPPVPKKKADDKKGMDAAGVASVVAAALAARDALHAARREVEPVIGVVAYDSAAEVYKAALTKLGVDTAGVDASAYPALLKMAKERAAAPSLAADRAVIKSMAEQFPDHNRLAH